MIDYVHLTTTYPVSEDVFENTHWSRFTFKDGTPVIYHRQHAVWIRYYPLKGRWTITGKIITLLFDTQVANVDDVYGSDLQAFAADINDCLQGLVNIPIPDILEWEVSRIDYCFNILTPYVDAYLDVMNEGFRMANNGSRVNYTQQKKLTGSAYVKTKTDYKDNTRRNYVLNYYDKFDRLEFLQKRGTQIPATDWQWATNVLRLEVQCGYVFIKELCEKLNMSRAFGDLLSYEVAYYAEAMIYRRVFKADADQDYLSYQTAKKRLGKQRKALEVLERSAEHHRITDSKDDYGRKQIQKAGIFPFAFLRKGSGVEVLANPLRLIWDKLVAMGAVEECA